MKSLEEIRKIKRKIEPDLLKRKNVNGVGIGYKIIGDPGQETDEIVIRVYVDEKKDNVPDNERIPDVVDGDVKTDVIQRARSAVAHNSGNLDTTPYDELQGGINVGPVRNFGNVYVNGTLGAIVKDNFSGKPMILSNYHTLAVDDNNKVGVDEISQPAGRGRKIARLENATLSGSVDAAVASIYDGVKHICEIRGIGQIKGVVSEKELDNMFTENRRHVRKSGIATNVTSGIIDDIESTRIVQYPYGIGFWTLNGQIIMKPDNSNSLFSNEGDSGSCILDDLGRIVGLLVGGDQNGYTVANHITDIINAFNISICTN